MAAVRRAKCILSVNTGDGVMDFVPPSSPTKYPQWKVSAPHKGEDEEDDVEASDWRPKISLGRPDIEEVWKEEDGDGAASASGNAADSHRVGKTRTRMVHYADEKEIEFEELLGENENESVQRDHIIKEQIEEVLKHLSVFYLQADAQQPKQLISSRAKEEHDMSGPNNPIEITPELLSPPKLRTADSSQSLLAGSTTDKTESSTRTGWGSLANSANPPGHDDPASSAALTVAESQEDVEDDGGVTYLRQCAARAQEIAKKNTMGLGLQASESLIGCSATTEDEEDTFIHFPHPSPSSPTRNRKGDDSPYSVQRKPFKSSLPQDLRDKVTNFRDHRATDAAELEDRILDHIEKEAPPPPPAAEKVLEDEILTGEHLSSLWHQHIFTALAAFRFGRAFIEKDAKASIEGILSPYIRRQVAKWENLAKRKALTNARFATMKRPSPQVLKAISDFFKDWNLPCLGDVIGRMEPVSYRTGETIFHEGDYSHDMYLVGRGNVEIVVRDGHYKEAPKSRRKKNGVLVATVNQGEVFGDGALLHYEPRGASAFASNDCDLWKISRKDFIASTATIPPITHLRFRRVVDEKRLENIRNVFPIRKQHLLDQPEFADFHTAAADFLLQQFSPKLFRGSDELCGPKSAEASIFLIVKGAVRAEPVDASSARTPRLLSPLTTSDQPIPPKKAGVNLGKIRGREYPVGKVFYPGDFLCIHECVSNEELTASFVVHGASPVEVWCLDRQSWLDVAREYPTCAVGAAEAIRHIKAQVLPTATLHDQVLEDTVLEHPLIRFCVPPGVMQQAWTDTPATLHLYPQGATLFYEGDPAAKTHLFVVEEGSLYDGYSRERKTLEREAASLQIEQNAEDKIHQSGYVVVDNPSEGHIYGLEEFALREETFRHTVRCASECRVWKLSRPALEHLLNKETPIILPQVTSMRKTILEHVQQDRLDDLDYIQDSPTKLLTRPALVKKNPYSFLSFRSSSNNNASFEKKGSILMAGTITSVLSEDSQSNIKPSIRRPAGMD